jgi:hypothetical protein
MIYLEDKVKIVSHLDDHEGYKKGQVVEVIAMDDDGMITVEGANGTQWYLDAEEVELVKKGARKFAKGSTVKGEKEYVVYGSVSTDEYYQNFSKIVTANDEDEAIEKVVEWGDIEYEYLWDVPQRELEFDLEARERMAKGSTVKSSEIVDISKLGRYAILYVPIYDENSVMKFSQKVVIAQNSEEAKAQILSKNKRARIMEVKKLAKGSTLEGKDWFCLSFKVDGKPKKQYFTSKAEMNGAIKSMKSGRWRENYTDIKEINAYAKGSTVEGYTSSNYGYLSSMNGRNLFSYDKRDYTINIDLKNFEIDVNIRGNDSVSQSALNDTDAEWEQHTWGYLIYPKSIEQVSLVLKALKVKHTKDELKNAFKPKHAKGSTIKGVKPIKVKAYGMDKRIVSLTQKAIDFLQEKFPQYRGEEELDSTEPYWDMVDAVRDNFDTDTPTKYGEIGEEIVRMYLAKENKYANGGGVGDADMETFTVDVHYELGEDSYTIEATDGVQAFQEARYLFKKENPEYKGQIDLSMRDKYADGGGVGEYSKEDLDEDFRHLNNRINTLSSRVTIAESQIKEGLQESIYNKYANGGNTSIGYSYSIGGL